MDLEVIRTVNVLSNATIEAGVQAGKLVVEGSVVRDAATGQIVQMLKEAVPEVANEIAVQTPALMKAISDLTRSAGAAAKSNPKTAISLVLGSVALGTTSLIVRQASSRRKQREAENHYKNLLERDIERASKDVERILVTDESVEDSKEVGAAALKAKADGPEENQGEVIDFATDTGNTKSGSK
ncbi:hypothetical protein ACTXIT_11470 [Corynebacterium casei]|uniref:Secreted protein n=2 Tax=Corynebacterium casei TaxID=160386 RepID=A0ABM5PNK1_9CORY|nr:hypothetical protein CCASEI_04885 [Corynebacterium casei LMG S-19264]